MSWKLESDPELSRQIQQAARGNALFHALLFTGSGDLTAAAHYAAAAMECTAAEKPCGNCEHCRKIQRDIHPDFMTVQDPEHQNIAMDVVRQVCADTFILPNEGARKIYLFPDCGLLTEMAQNVLLKVVEEGPTHAAFLFCAADPGTLLPTIRSRCIELHPRPTNESPAIGMYGATFCKTMARKRLGAVTEFMISLEKDKKFTREMMAQMLEDTERVLSAALSAGYGIVPGREESELAALLAGQLTKRQITAMITLVRKYRQNCEYNVNVKQVCGALAVEWEAIL